MCTSDIQVIICFANCIMHGSVFAYRVHHHVHMRNRNNTYIMRNLSDGNDAMTNRWRSPVCTPL